jgi:hypothetical protein
MKSYGQNFKRRIPTTHRKHRLAQSTQTGKSRLTLDR